MTQEEYNGQAGRYRSMTEQWLRRLLPENCADMPSLLSRSMRYSLLAGGKRLRPSLMLHTVELLGGRAEDALTCACALEMIHTYSLIHDDLPGMDNDSLRRGKPTNHVVFGEGQAILAGDGLLTYAFECVLNDAFARDDTAALRELRALKYIAAAAGCKGMVAGQCADLECENAADANGRADYAGIVTPDGGESRGDMLGYIHMRKTARMIMAAFEAGCALAGADADTCARLMRFAEPFGLLFQVVDDYLDACGDSVALGKSVGKDAQSGKLTYVSLYGIERTLEIRDGLVAQARAALDAIPGSDFLRCELEAMACRDR